MHSTVSITNVTDWLLDKWDLRMATVCGSTVAAAACGCKSFVTDCTKEWPHTRALKPLTPTGLSTILLRAGDPWLRVTSRQGTAERLSDACS